MATLNKKATRGAVRTHEGVVASRTNSENQLRRSVMSCMLWEGQFYEDGESIADRIAGLIKKVDPATVAEIAIEAREQMKLRHVPLLIVREMARTNGHKAYVSKTLESVIQRPDELTEFLSIYWKDGKEPLSKQVKKGLASAFTKFDEYSLSKYNRNRDVKLRDVLFLCHAKPKNKAQGRLWKKLVDNKLAVADTWETNLSEGQDKKKTWERLMREGQLGALAMIRNLRNMEQARVSKTLICSTLKKMNVSRVFPYRFITAARFAPAWEGELEEAMMRCLKGRKKLPGKTVLLLDVSGSMDDPLSAKSDVRRMDASAGIAVMLREICDEVAIYTFSAELKRVASRHGFALRDAINSSQEQSGTLLGAAVKAIDGTQDIYRLRKHPWAKNFKAQNEDYDRLIVFTDEQSHDPVPSPKGTGYMVNVASYEHGVGYGKWHKINGWSESVIDYIQVYEEMENAESRRKKSRRSSAKRVSRNRKLR